MIYRIGCTALAGGFVTFFVERLNDQIGVFGAALLVVGMIATVIIPRFRRQGTHPWSSDLASPLLQLQQAYYTCFCYAVPTFQYSAFFCLFALVSSSPGDAINKQLGLNFYEKRCNNTTGIIRRKEFQMFTRKYYTRTLSGLTVIAGSVSVFMDHVSKEGWGIIFTGVFMFICSFVYRRYKATRPVKRGKEKKQ